MIYKYNHIVRREKFIEAVKSELAPTELREDEGVGISYGYVKPLYLQPTYQNRIVYGKWGGIPLIIVLYLMKRVYVLFVRTYTLMFLFHTN